MVGKIVLHQTDQWSFPGIVEGEWPGGGYRCRGFRDCGIIPNAVYTAEELRELTAEDFDQLSNHQVECLILLRDRHNANHSQTIL
ncbi:hypothetical protein [Tunicatimonas pelagia]|uniref:hypothetical protein n=1 Tax=Tunicatimonas pelagia TaxID=931531 RepID=UPI00266543F1|nr:hypothetical protein [Tunicatimonas pelagia]WKN46499.1 hypothetical protein P0M28_30580 [Tunicatimonas pelagia]